MELRLKVDNSFVNKLNKKLGKTTATALTQDALTLLNWAVEEISKNRVILSSDENGNDIKRLEMPVFHKVKKDE